MLEIVKLFHVMCIHLKLIFYSHLYFIYEAHHNALFAISPSFIHEIPKHRHTFFSLDDFNFSANMSLYNKIDPSILLYFLCTLYFICI